jgi:hypothetical protein
MIQMAGERLHSDLNQKSQRSLEFGSLIESMLDCSIRYEKNNRLRSRLSSSQIARKLLITDPIGFKVAPCIY